MQFMSNFAVAAWRSWTSSTTISQSPPASLQPRDSAANPVALGHNFGAQAIGNVGQVGARTPAANGSQRTGNMGDVSCHGHNPSGGTPVTTHGALQADFSNMDTDPPSPPSGEGAQQTPGVLVPSGAPGRPVQPPAVPWRY